MILNFDEMKLKLLRGEAIVNKYSAPLVDEAMLIARHDCLREVLEFTTSYSNDPIIIDYLRGLLSESAHQLQEGA